MIGGGRGRGTCLHRALALREVDGKVPGNGSRSFAAAVQVGVPIVGVKASNVTAAADKWVIRAVRVSRFYLVATDNVVGTGKLTSPVK